MPVVLAALLFARAAGMSPAAHAAAGDGVDGALTYAVTHWNWAIYDNSLPQVAADAFQPQFQCAEFVARSLASAGPIGPLTPGGSDATYANVTYNNTAYNLKLVSGLYHFLLDTSVGTDAGTNLSSATLGSVLIYGNAQDGDFLHTVLVTDTTNPANPLFSAHNAAYLYYPAAQPMYDEYGRQMAITHILQINYGLIAGGALQTSVGTVSGGSIQMNAPAPYHGSIVTSGISLSWQPVTGAQTYNVSLYDVNGRLIDGLSTATPAFSFDLSTVAYGIYDYVIQPQSSSASFVSFYDEFNYEPPACLASAASRTAAGQVHAQSAVRAANSSTSCGTGSGTGVANSPLTLSPAAIALTVTPGTTPGAQGVIITNGGTTTYSWELGREPSWVTVVPDAGSLAPGASTSITVYFWDQGIAPSATPGTYSTVLQIVDTAGVYPPVSLPVSVAETNVSQQWYFAEGYTGGSFTEYLTLANPGSASANVTVEYLLANVTPITRSYGVAPGSRATINVNKAIGAGQNVSMVVSSDQPIVAERPMYFTFNGLSGYSIPGGSDVLGATQLGTQFDFGYLDTSPGHATYLTILNPNGASMTATIEYFAAGGGTPTTIMHTIAANSRGTVNVNKEGLSPGSYSALITLSVPGLVERPMYLVDSVTGYTGSTDVVGVAQPSTAWYFAEGRTGTNFSERYILSNPSTTASANATVTFYRPNGSTATAPVSIPPGGQQVVSANAVLGNGVSNSTSVTADAPILAERFMSFEYTGPVGSSKTSQIPGATDVLGSDAPGYVFFFAEGFTGGSFGEYLTLENPNPATAHVTVLYLPQNGSAPIVVTYAVSPTSRSTVFTNQVMPGQSFSMEVFADQPIVAERPMYFSYSGKQTGGTDIVGYQPSAPLASPAAAWNVQASVSPSPISQYNNYLYGVAAVSSNDVWAVGQYLTSNNWAPLIEHWDGTNWSVIPSPSVYGGGLQGVAVVAPNDVWAVGVSQVNELIEHWDGTSWSVVPAPHPGTGGNQLFAVAVVSANDIWAVGDSYDTATSTTSTLTEHWDGTSWTAVSSAGSSKYGLRLQGVTAISSTDVWAVGKINPTNTGPYPWQTLTMHWDGSAWSIVSSPNPAPAGNNSLKSVAAAASNDVWAVGSGAANSSVAIVEHWDGSSWTAVSTPSSPSFQNIAWLDAVAIVSPTDIWAVGAFGSNYSALIEHWDGSSWTIVPDPEYTTDELASLAVVSAHDIWGVGFTDPTYYPDFDTFTEHYGS